MSASPLNYLELTDDEACNLNRARHLLNLVGNLAEPELDKDHWRAINRESLAVFMGVVEGLLPSRF